MRRKYISNKLACVKIYLEYVEKDEKSALEYANKIFGENEESDWALKLKLKLTDKGGWKTDWLTNMFRDLDEILRKYGVKEQK
jgi:hypothetical protein